MSAETPGKNQIDIGLQIGQFASDKLKTLEAEREERRKASDELHA